MSANAKPQSFSFRQEDGFLLLGVLFMVLLILIALAVAAPKMAESIRRDKEIETVHRGLQYARAIQVYFNKYGRYPSTIDQLMKTDNQRFLRKRYLDPMTGKDDWRIIHFGEATPQNIGLFGQTVQQNGITPTGASTSTGTGASSSSPFGGSSSSFGASGSSPSSASPTLGSSGSGFGSSGSSFGSGSSTSPFSSSGSSSSPFSNSGSSTSPIGGTDSTTGGSYGSSTGIGGTSPTGAGGMNNLNTPQTTGGSSSAFGSPGVSVGGAPIVGVGLLSKKASIKIYKKQDHYNKWEFVFDPNQNAANAVASTGATTGTGLNGSNGTGTGTGTGGFNNGPAGGGFNNGSGSGGFSSGSGFGSSNGSGFGSSNGSGFGSSNGSGFGGSPTSPTSPTTPTTNSPQ
jgi:type II secretory pathway pseudopilin PulG